MASFTAGTTFVDGVSNDVTAAKLGNLVTNATPTSGFIQDRTAETVTATNDTLLIGDASDSNNLKRITVANFAQTLPTAKVTTGTIETGTFGTTTSTAATITTGTITTGVIPTLTTGTTTSTNEVVTNGTITNLSATTSTFLGTITGSTNVVNIGSGQIYKDASGNVGVGTASPGTKLDVVASANSGIRVTNGTMTGIFFNSSDTSIAIGSQTNHPVNLYANNSIAATIGTNGNVGIGVTSPDSVLSVYANNKTTPAISARYSAAGFKAGLSVYNSLGFPYLSFNANPVSGSDNATYDINGVASKIDFATSSGSANIIFSNAASGTAGSTISWLERMRIDSSGNVGIGVTSPVYKLDVSGLVRINSAFAQLVLADTTGGTTTGGFVRYVSNGAGGSYTYQINTAAAGDFTTTNNAYTISSAGNVGIGVTAPVNKLDVVGSFGRGAPVTKTADFSLADTENWLIVNKGSSCTVTLPAASSWTGREFTIKVITAHAVVSASSNVVPRNSATPGTAILAAAAGNWATLVSNGTNWVIMCGS